MSPVTPRHAASLLLVRDSDAGRGPEIYMVRRHPRSAFMANALVFVGGVVDPADRSAAALERCSGLDPAGAAARLGLDDPELALGFHVAALRECLEEAGVLLAEPTPAPDVLTQMRDQLNRDDLPLAPLLQAQGLTLAVGRLRYLDHWTTPEFEHRRYDTRFFVGPAPAGQRASHDPGETTFGGWLTVEGALEGNRRRELHLPPPTLAILEGLQGCRTAAELLARAPDRPVPHTMPRPLLQSGAPPTLLFPGDHRYDDPGSAGGPVDCVELVEGNWRRVRS
jgi:8-oxo-dGTP pyrophosphatase MutT (NUDIX family)